jgi:hypothetical protein
MTHGKWTAAAFLWAPLMAFAYSAAEAADVTYAPGSRVGLVTGEGLTPSKRFPGFEDSGRGVRVVASELPGSAYTRIELAIAETPELPGQPERFETALGPAYLSHEQSTMGDKEIEQFAMITRTGRSAALVTVQIPKAATSAWPEAAVRNMLATVALRQEVPVDEQFAQLPFKIHDLGGFRTVRTLTPGRVVLLSDGEGDDAVDHPTSMVVTFGQGAPNSAEDRGRFAQLLMGSLPGLKNARVTLSEPMRIGTAPGFETRMEAVLDNSETPVVLVQWLRFATSGFIRMVGVAPRDEWESVSPRLRAIRDTLEVKVAYPIPPAAPAPTAPVSPAIFELGATYIEARN